MAEQSINIPQVLVFLVVSFLAVRWYFSKPATAATARTHTAHARISPAQIDQVASMFPQLSRRDIAWDLSRNGGNVAATTERALAGRGLETAPPSFVLQTPTPAAAPRRTTPAAAKPAQPDLITRYNLSSKLSQVEPVGEEQPKKAWSQDKNERQKNLQRRREEMILAARRKLEAQEKGKAPA